MTRFHMPSQITDVSEFILRAKTFVCDWRFSMLESKEVSLIVTFTIGKADQHFRLQNYKKDLFFTKIITHILLMLTDVNFIFDFNI